MQPLNDIQKSMRWFGEVDESTLQNESIRKSEYYALLALYPYGCMERIGWRFAWETGARPVEIVRLARTNFSENLQEVTFCAAKGKVFTKVRHCYLSKGFARELEYYLSILISPNNFIFPSRYAYRPVLNQEFFHTELDRRRVHLYRLTDNERWIQKKENGYSILHPYSFRYAKIASLLDQGYNIAEIALYLGHTRINTTMQYARFHNQRKFQKSARIEPDVTQIYVDDKQQGLVQFL